MSQIFKKKNGLTPLHFLKMIPNFEKDQTNPFPFFMIKRKLRKKDWTNLFPLFTKKAKNLKKEWTN